MSGKKNAVNPAENQKVMTKYDRKLEQRKAEAERAKKEEKKGILIGIALLVALAAFVVSFPIRSYLAVNGAYIKIGGEKVTQVEFDMQYNISKNSYVEQMSYYLSMFGMSDVSTLEYESYTEDLTFGDYFAQLAAEGLVEQRALIAKAKAAGFEHDTTAELEDMKAGLEEMAEQAGVSFNQYVTGVYGPLATWKRITPYVENSLYAAAYYNEVMAENMPTEDDLKAEYNANTATYDSVDYHLSIVDAQLPTTAPDGTVQKDENGKEIAYEPTEDEIALAMKDAYLKAQEIEKTVATEGTEYKGADLKNVSSNISAFLSDESRKPGDTTIVEVASSNKYWVVSFDGRYLDEAPTHDLRMLYTSLNPQTILDEWKAGEATEDTFQELVAKYDEAGAASTGGLYSGMKAADMGEELHAWLSEERQAGDTIAIADETDAYVTYYVAENEPAWKLNARTALVSTKMQAFLEEAKAGFEIEDKKEKLVYLHIEE